MRKIILWFFASILTLNLKAQVVNKSDRLFGGSLTFSVFNINYSGPAYNNVGNIGILPSFAWAIQNDLALGIRENISFTHSGNKISSTDKTSDNSFNFGTGVFLKKYKLLKNRFGLYFNNEATVNYLTSKNTSTSLPEPLKSHSWGGMYSFQPGVFYKFSEHFFGEGNIGGAYASYYANGSDKIFGIGLSFLQYFNLGINYRIEKKK